MKNFVEDGLVATVTAPSDVSSGDFVLVGAIYGVAQTDAASGDPVAVVREGVFTLPKDTAAAWTQGDKLYWDAGASKFTKTAGANRPLGVAFADALQADATGLVSIEENPAEGVVFVSGQITTVTATDTVVTGLSKVTSCGAGLDDNPGDNPISANATLGDQNGAPAAGSIVVKTWQDTSGTDPTPLAATTFSKKVNWWAAGTR